MKSVFLMHVVEYAVFQKRLADFQRLSACVHWCMLEQPIHRLVAQEHIVIVLSTIPPRADLDTMNGVLNAGSQSQNPC